MTWGVPLSVSCHFAFSNCSWGSQGKNTEVACHSLLQWTRELPDVQAGFRKGRGTRDQIANIRWIMEKATEFQKKTSISALLTMPKPLTVWITIDCGKF